MPDRCVVYGCSNSNSPESGISLYRIPFAKTTNSEAKRRRRVWIQFIQRTRKNFTPSSSSSVCSEHFSIDSFNIQYPVPGLERRLIRDEIGVVGVPTIYPKAPAEVQQQVELSSRGRRKVRNFFSDLFCSRKLRNLRTVPYL